METAGTTAGGIATVATPLGATQTRGGGLLSGKYTKDSTPNTPRAYKRKQNVGRRFKNSPSN